MSISHVKHVWKGKRVAVLCGGVSGEREVSLRSGKNVYDALKRQGYICELVDVAYTNLLDLDCDVAFLALHGEFEEGGGMQALLESLGIPFTGSDSRSSQLAMNKLLSKVLFLRHGIPTASFAVLRHPTDAIPFPFPFVVKPIGEGSSLGVRIIQSENMWVELLPELMHAHGLMMAEPYIEGQEVTVGILEMGDELLALPPLELRPKRGFYDYHAKYTAGETEFILPADLNAALTEACLSVAARVHRVLGCRGFSRVDMRVHPKMGPMVLELNSLPGLTDLSDLPAQAQCAGISFDTLVTIILDQVAVS